MNKTLKAHYAQAINLDNALISAKNGERKFTQNLFSVWHNDEKLFAKIMTEIGRGDFGH
jgi:hypothetical protein